MIAILMATYNGERFIKEQIESILVQSQQDFILYITDDASTDGTIDILHGYAAQYPDKIFVRQNTYNTGSAKYNFLDMMVDGISAEYYMLSDQDDVWLPNKIEQSMQAMAKLEEEHGCDEPLLVYTDLCVVDADLKLLWKSFNGQMAIDTTRRTINEQIVQNTLTGNTALYNRALAKILKMPEYCAMHDGWLMQTAVAFGHIKYIEEPTLLYRQHGRNEIGAKNPRSIGYLFRALFRTGQIKENIMNTYKQACSFFNAYTEILSEEQKQFLLDYMAIPTYSKLKRWREVKRLGARKGGLLRQIGQFIHI